MATRTLHRSGIVPIRAGGKTVTDLKWKRSGSFYNGCRSGNFKYCKKMTTVAENVVVMTPVYNIFFNSILNNGRNVLESRLKYENGAYQIDFDDLEENLQIRRRPCCCCVIRIILSEKSGTGRNLKESGNYAGNIMYWCFLTKSTAILQSRARTIVRLLRYLKRVK